MIARVANPNLPQVTVALGGGGARGLAHFGAVQAIGESPLQIERYVGVSMGSMAGALLASESDPRSVQTKVLEYLASPDFAGRQEALFGAQPGKAKNNSGLLAWYDQIKSYLWARQMLGRVFRHSSLLAGHVLEGVIAQLIPDIDIADLPIPLSIVAVDLKSGQPIVLERGPLRRAIAASAAIPGIFPPIAWEHMWLCDIGVLDSLPTQLARSYGSDIVIGVDVGPQLERATNWNSALHVLLRMDEIGERWMRRHAQRAADILIQPLVGHWAWFDFSQPQRLIAAGYEAAERALSAWSHQQPAWSKREALQGLLNCPALNSLTR